RGGSSRSGQAPALRLPFNDDAGVLLPALGGAVPAQEYVAPLAEAVGQGDDGLPALGGQGIGGNVQRTTVGHAATLSVARAEVFRACEAFRPHFRPSVGTR